MTDSDMLETLRQRINELEAAAPQHPWPSEPLNCPDCSNQGWYAVGCAGDFEQVQCRFCYTEPNSVFNRTQQAAPQHESQWQPIETAPRDGKLILAHNSIMGVTCIVGWDKGREDDEPHWSDVPNRNQAESFWFNGNYFSHWMPLPQHPNTIKVPRPEGHDSWSIEITSSCGGGGGKPHDTPKDK